MTGIYLRCDTCGVTLGGEEVTSNPEQPPNWAQPDRLIDAARALGWTGPLTRDSATDKCPKCSTAASASQSR